MQVNSLSQWPGLIKFKLYYRDLNRKPKTLKVLLLAKEVKQGFGGRLYDGCRRIVGFNIAVSLKAPMFLEGLGFRV